MHSGDLGSSRDDAAVIRRLGGGGMYAQTLLQFILDDQARPAILGIERRIDLQTIEIVVETIPDDVPAGAPMLGLAATTRSR